MIADRNESALKQQRCLWMIVQGLCAVLSDGIMLVHVRPARKYSIYLEKPITDLLKNDTVMGRVMSAYRKLIGELFLWTSDSICVDGVPFMDVWLDNHAKMAKGAKQSTEDLTSYYFVLAVHDKKLLKHIIIDVYTNIREIVCEFVELKMRDEIKQQKDKASHLQTNPFKELTITHFKELREKLQKESADFHLPKGTCRNIINLLDLWSCGTKPSAGKPAWYKDLSDVQPGLLSNRFYRDQYSENLYKRFTTIMMKKLKFRADRNRVLWNLEHPLSFKQEISNQLLLYYNAESVAVYIGTAVYWDETLGSRRSCKLKAITNAVQRHLDQRVCIKKD
ncbi:uncharacterized protein [Dysidea avara]|uniref:uncharacterized protein isoform X2 n=1 Tax=Dysidea avara TaxID=196820 RepID=UPI0033271F43